MEKGKIQDMPFIPKHPITKSDLQNRPIVASDYATLCALGDYLPRFCLIGYNAGRDGWNYDAYYFGDYVISFGYRPIGEANEKADAIIKNCANQAEQYARNGNASMDDITWMVAHYLNKWLRVRVLENPLLFKDALKSDINAI